MGSGSSHSIEEIDDLFSDLSVSRQTKPSTVKKSYLYLSDSGTFGHFVLDEEFRVPVQLPAAGSQKTVAIVNLPDQAKSVKAYSGWSHGKSKTYISGDRWTKRVLSLAEDVRHTFECCSFDQGVKGQYQACLAEAQLVAYIIYTYVYIDSDDDSEEQSTAASISEDDFLEVGKAQILASKDPCRGCREFVMKVNKEFSLSITLEDCSRPEEVPPLKIKITRRKIKSALCSTNEEKLLTMQPCQEL